MAIVAVANVKGGVGKTTIAVHLAVYLSRQGLSVCCVDTDPQSLASKWLAESGPGIALASLLTADDILEETGQLTQDWVIVDCQGNNSEVTRAVLLVADTVLVPCGPSPLDLLSTATTVRLAKQARSVRQGGKPDVLIVPNRIQRTRLSADLPETLAQLQEPVYRGSLGLRQAFAQAYAEGRTVLDMSNSLASQEVLQLCKEILEGGSNGRQKKKKSRKRVIQGAG